MSFDGMVTAAIAHQLSQLLAGGRIDKIYQPEGDELLFHIHAGRETHRLYLSANGGHARVHLTQADFSNPQNPSSFCMLLRKHFQGGRIRSIRQLESERILEFVVDHINELGFSQEKMLLVEIMGKHSNIIALESPSLRILDSIKRISFDVNRYRQILPGLPYVMPPSKDKIPFRGLTVEQMDSILQKDSSCSGALVAGIQGLSPTLADELCIRAAGNPSIQYDPTWAHALWSHLTELVASVDSGESQPVVYLTHDEPIEFHVTSLSVFGEYHQEQPFQDPSSAVDFYFTNRASTNQIRQKASDLYKAVQNNLDKLYLKKQRLAEDLLKAEGAEQDKLYGELLVANLHRIPQGLARVELENYYDQTTVIISLDPRYSPSENAQRYYRRYNKAKIARIEKQIQLEETDRSIEYLESVKTFVDQATSAENLTVIRQELMEGGFLRMRKDPYRQSKPKSIPFGFTTADGFRVLIGRNNKENDILTFQTADKKDYWFHTKDIPGSHVVLVTDGRQPSDSAIEGAASLAAYYSKARDASKVPVDFTQVRHVKKPSGAKPGMVIFTDQKTVYVDPVKEL